MSRKIRRLPEIPHPAVIERTRRQPYIEDRLPAYVPAYRRDNLRRDEPREDREYVVDLT